MSGSVETLLRSGGKLCMHLIAKAIRISRAKFHCNRLTTVLHIHHIQDYASIFFLAHIVDFEYIQILQTALISSAHVLFTSFSLCSFSLIMRHTFSVIVKSGDWLFH